MRTNSMIRYSTLALLLTVVAGSEALADRDLTVEALRDNKVVLRTRYTDEGNQSAVDVWRYTLGKEPTAEAEIADFEAEASYPKMASLNGSITLRIRSGDSIIGEAHLEQLLLVRKDPNSNRWFLGEFKSDGTISDDEVYRTAFEAGLSDMTMTEWYHKRLTDNFPYVINGESKPGGFWWWVLIPVLVLAGLFVFWMYIKDMRSIPWWVAILLGLLRCTVYALLAYMFLLPTVKTTRTWFPKIPPVITKQSHVIMVLDVSDSMTTIDDPKTLPQSQRRSRLQKVVDFLTDDNVAFLKKLLDKNPVYVYRFGDRLDKDNVVNFANLPVKDKDGKEVIESRPYVVKRLKDGTGREEKVPLQRWSPQDWVDYATFTDFKAYIVKGLSDKAKAIVEKDFPTGPGNLDWAQIYLGQTKETIISKADLVKKVGGTQGETDASILESNLSQLDNRINLARTIGLGTNVTDSVQKAYDATKDSMLEGIVVFSDGRSNIGLPPKTEASKDAFQMTREMEALHRSARKDNVLIFTVAVGDDRRVKTKAVRITDLQSLDRAPPDDAFKVIVEMDGENMPGESVEVFLELTPPKKEEVNITPLIIEGRLNFDRSEPPHGQFEWTIDPKTLIDRIAMESRSDFYIGKELREGEWQIRAFTAKVKEDGTPDGKEKIFSDPAKIQIVKKPMRILVMCSAPNRDFQFLINQLIRDKADLSVYVQNEAGRFLDGKSITYLDKKERHLREFPNHLDLNILSKNPENYTENDWLNLAIYDAIVAFDPDWTLLTESQAKDLQSWVDLNAGGLLHVAGPIYTRKLTYPENAEKMAPLLNIFPVELADYDLKMAARERKFPRRLEFPGATGEMEFLRLDDDKPDDFLSGWEPFFTGKATREEGMKAELKRGFFDYYPVKNVKAGATIVAEYMEPNSADNTFNKREPPYIVAYRYGQGWTAFMGSSEIWRFRQHKDANFERFWVKMCRFLASGNRKKQNRRGRILMAKEFVSGDAVRITPQLLDSNLKGMKSAPAPVKVEPVELDDYSGMELFRKKGLLPAKVGTTPEEVAKEKEKYHALIARNYLLAPRKNDPDPEAGYFEIDRASDLFPAYLRKKISLDPKDPSSKNVFEFDLPAGVWKVTVPISVAEEQFLISKFTIRKPLPPELSDIRPDLVSLSAIASEVDELKPHVLKKPELLEQMRSRAFKNPLTGERLAFHINDRQTIEMIPDCLRTVTQEINNPQTEPEIRKSKIEPRWFGGPTLPRWATGWYDDWQKQSRREHQIALWMLVCIGLLSVEWLTRKLLKLA